jgi:hypothetical protein
MGKEQLAIGQVGASGPESFTGLSPWMKEQRLLRVVILEPNSFKEDHDEANSGVARTARITNNTVIYRDIFKPIVEWKAPPLGFLLLENVLNDPNPGYVNTPNTSILLAQNLETIMVQDGLVLVTHSGDPYERDRDHLYAPLNQAMNACAFVTILDEVTEHNFVPSTQRRDDYFRQREHVILTALNELNLLDPPFIQGIVTHAGSPIEYWMLFQKTTVPAKQSNS